MRHIIALSRQLRENKVTPLLSEEEQEAQLLLQSKYTK